MDDFDFDDDDDSYTPQLQIATNVWRDQERVGHNELLTTDIEYGRLAKLQQQKNFFNPEMRLEASIKAYFYEVRSYYKGLNQPDLVTILDIVRSLPNKLYKNPHIIVLGYILSRIIRQADPLKTIRDLIKKTGQEEIVDTDVIRYYRLLQLNPLHHS